MPPFHFAQLRYLSLFFLAWLAAFCMTRTGLVLGHLATFGASGHELIQAYAIGLLYDLSFLLFATLPLALYLLCCPRRLWQQRWHRAALHMLLGLSLFVMLSTAVAEWMFWDEFAARFNFIAVDYLLYSNEVLDDMLESYSIYPLLAALAVIAVIGAVLLRNATAAALRAPLLGWRGRVLTLTSLALLAGLSSALLDQGALRTANNSTYLRELASNGPYQFFAALRNNELDYPQFYSTLPKDQVAKQLRAELNEANAHFIGNQPLDIRRVIDNPGPAQRHNVILVTVESLSTNYLGSFGDTRQLTPNLDRLRQQSLFFNNCYATGSRTDRGLEAISLSIPPTPGRAIVKRINRESGFASLGQQFQAQGYDSVFVYAGRGYLDNLNTFFGGNGYRVFDLSSVDKHDVEFENAWGMSDEDLYRQTLKLADADHAAGKPFFMHLMTTSNQRPYTYPDGRIDIASGQGRAGAVKYTDYAIGQFLQQARQQPWFSNTLFIFVADHSAGSAGTQDLSVANYHIPLFIYAPGLIKPREFTGLTSQIDLAPTLLGLLNFDYVSTFFGRNVLREQAAPERVLIGNQQHLGLFDGHDLAILSPRKTTRRHDNALGISHELSVSTSDPLIDRDIAYYQSASYGFSNGLLGWQAANSLTASALEHH
jgi:phosphoglycerol transferase MdoB-like AlkP superfamily enzyme